MLMTKHIRNCCKQIALVALLSSGCATISDENQADAQTYSNLRTYESTLLSLNKAGFDILQFKSLEGFLEFCTNTGVLTKLDYLRINRDGWGNVFTWVNRVSMDGEREIWIISSGRNQILENGGGDDMYCKVMLDKSGRATSNVHASAWARSFTIPKPSATAGACDGSKE